MCEGAGPRPGRRILWRFTRAGRPYSCFRRVGALRPLGHTLAAAAAVRRTLLPRSIAEGADRAAPGRRGDRLALDLTGTCALQCGDHAGLRDPRCARISG